MNDLAQTRPLTRPLDRPLTRRAVLAGAGAVGAFAALPLGRSNAAPIDVGQWTSPLALGGQAIHAALTNAGFLLFFGYTNGAASSYVGSWDYTSGAVAQAPLTYARDIFCGGMNFQPNGDLYVSGGHNATIKVPDSVGVAETDLFHPATRTWTHGPLLTEKRWYPTQVGLPNGLTYIFGGWETSDHPALSVEVYDSSAGTLHQLPASANQSLKLYPHMRLMPDGRIAKTGGSRTTIYFNPATNTWATGPNMKVGNRPWGTSVLLSGGRQVLTFGGKPVSTSPPTKTAEILDLGAATPTWQYTGSLSFGRIHCNGVVLPDGKVLVVGGGTDGNLSGPIKSAELYDPATGTWSVMASQLGVRMYHSTALLLPDGRVWSGGTNGTYANTAEVFSPPYLFNGPRPTVSAMDASASPGNTFTLTSADAASISKVSLVRPGSVTHQVNTDQRHHFLGFTVNGSTVTCTLPSNPNLIPVGHYLVFALNAQGVPSIGRWLQIT